MHKSGLCSILLWLLAVVAVRSEAADELQGRFDALNVSVKGLPAATDVEQAKKAVLALALERARGFSDAGKAGEATALANDVAAALSKDANEMARAHTPAPHILLFTPVRVRNNNPDLDALVAKTRKKLAVPEEPWPVCTLEKPTFKALDGNYGTRTAAVCLRDDLWLYANPDSPLRGNPELLTRLLRRAHAYIDSYDIADDPANKGKPDLYDQFAVKEAFSGLYEWVTVYPGLLLPSQRTAWDLVLRKCANRLWNGLDGKGGMKDAKAWNLNQELARMVGVLNLGYYTRNQAMIDKVMALVNAVIAKMYPDGAWPYNGSGNPSCNYHDEVVGALTRIYDQTGYEPIKNALIASQWKGPMMGRTDEMWTSPFFKAYRWNVAKGVEAGTESVATLSRNGYVRTMLDAHGPRPDRDNATWYDNRVLPLPLPDRYTLFDRNTGGPRAWYGTFTYAGTFRSPPPQEAGLETLMGAMTVDAADGRVNSVLVDVTPRVRVAAVEPAPGTMSAGSVNGNASPAVAKQTTDMTGVTAVAKNFSVSSAAYTLATTKQDAYKGPSSDWDARQVWIGLPDRMVGLISTVPRKEGAQAYEVDGVLRLISRGTAGAAVCKKIELLEPNHYRYGELDVIIHESTYGQCEPRIIPYRQADFPATELTLRDAPSLKAGNQPLRYPMNTDLRFVVEVRPASITAPAVVSRLADGKLMGLRVASGGKTWLAWFNPTDAAQPATLPHDLPANLPQSLRFSLPGKSELPTQRIPHSLVLAAHQQAVLVVSPDPLDAEPGWSSFAEMAAKTASKAP